MQATGFTAKMELARFAEKWSNPNSPPEQVDAAALSRAERELEVTFPEEYREQDLAVGLPHPTRALLSAINDTRVDLYELSELFQPDEIVSATVGWQPMGLPRDLIAIGSDGSGNKFCFNAIDLTRNPGQPVPIYFWDHDFLFTRTIARSFTDWIALYRGRWADGRTYKDF